MIGKKFAAAAVACAVILTAGVAAAAPKTGSSASASSKSSSSSAPQKSGGCHGHGMRMGGDFGAMRVLSDLTGTSVDDLMAKYPQKTSWQIAKTIGKLDELKTGFLNKQKTFLDRLVSEGRLSTDESSKVFADLQKRVAAIDGVNTVTLGRPGYRPQINTKSK